MWVRVMTLVAMVLSFMVGGPSFSVPPDSAVRKLSGRAGQLAKIVGADVEHPDRLLSPEGQEGPPAILAGQLGWESLHEGHHWGDRQSPEHLVGVGPEVDRKVVVGDRPHLAHEPGDQQAPRSSNPAPRPAGRPPPPRR